MSALTDGLRGLADFLDGNPELAEHVSSVTFDRLLVPVSHVEDPKGTMAAFARAAGKAAKSYDDKYAGLDIDFGPYVSLHVYASREQVCERVVTGMEVVTREVPDPEALAAVPTTTVTETVETVEWICSPLLAPTPSTMPARVTTSTAPEPFDGTEAVA